ncbi:MAG: aminotransferase class I/II-fold pyridoxal phosphate-dependent enzyme [Alicyclobacillus herbarius]|uniref:aminotransferase class I/II-fold pyridoxal phosphate-dependent enzyme n=1 Tax=Alicyclobacillus herbarius TaxID=122960 RepID=UPI0004219D8C|nr:aminotransferase class I/II-fold pyridoxal phosphate-dependent enzyme [Alicyclobacillus herbarius]MCL6632631.1 aminotransferase class I/II-fold pyridoxal phosphate-dependent enzyme [Alicyclobacillus herbarius]
MKTLTSRLSPIVQNLPPSGIRRFFDLANQMEGVISLGVGEPDFVTPWHIREAGIYSLEQGYTSYTSNRGLPELCAEICAYLTRYGLEYDPAREVFVTIGGSEAIDLALRALICPGDEVLIPEPTYVAYRPCALLAGAQVVGVPTRAEDEFRLTPELLEAHITPRAKVLVLCFPNNPTGSVMTDADLRAIAEVAMRHDLMVISDEIYAELTYGHRHVSIASLPGMKERTIVIGGMSKAYAMTGWRIGYAAGPADILGAMLKIHQYTILCAPVTAQLAALEALRNGEAEKDRMVASYDQRRRLIVQGLRDIGLPCHEPKGAFYAFPDIRPTGLSSEAFAEQLLTAEKVAVVPGSVFGAAGEGFVRCSYATSVTQIERALERIGRFVRTLG